MTSATSLTPARRELMEAEIGRCQLVTTLHRSQLLMLSHCQATNDHVAWPASAEIVATVLYTGLHVGSCPVLM